MHTKRLVIHQLSLADSSRVCARARVCVRVCVCARLRACVTHIQSELGTGQAQQQNEVRVSVLRVKAVLACTVLEQVSTTHPNILQKGKKSNQRGSRNLPEWDKQTTGKKRRKKEEILSKMLLYN